MLKQLFIYIILIVVIIIGYRYSTREIKTPVSALPLPLQSQGEWVVKIETLADSYEAKIDKANSPTSKKLLADTLQFEYSSLNQPTLVQTAISQDYAVQADELQKRGSVAQARIRNLLANVYGK